MVLREDTSTFLQEANKILLSAGEAPLSLAERKKKASFLASALLQEAMSLRSSSEKKQQRFLQEMAKDLRGKAFLMNLTDQCRSASAKRFLNQFSFLLNHFGIPRSLPFQEKMRFLFLKIALRSNLKMLSPFIFHSLKRETSHLFLPKNLMRLSREIRAKKEENLRINLHYIGEKITGEEQTKQRLAFYLEALENPDIDCISVKLSDLLSSFSPLAWEESLEKAAKSLRMLYLHALDHPCRETNGTVKTKYVTLDMEEYPTFAFTVELFKKVLEDPVFFSMPAGIVLQSYLPEAFEVQKQLTQWSKKRLYQGAVPIKICLTKGAYLGKEQIESSKKGWPQAPFLSKVETDANYKKMLSFGLTKENASAVRIGIASHNLFDLSFALLLQMENNISPLDIDIEMLEGRVEHLRKALSSLLEPQNILLYCPVTNPEESQEAISYLLRRLDENTGFENFLRKIYDLKPGTEHWEEQENLFSQSCQEIETLSSFPRRNQNREENISSLPPSFSSFENESVTDFSLASNRLWAKKALQRWKEVIPEEVPLVIGGKTFFGEIRGTGFDPVFAGKPLYSYSIAMLSDIEKAIKIAQNQIKIESLSSWETRYHLLAKAAHILRKQRQDFFGVLIFDSGMNALEADQEISEAIDLIEYYRIRLEKYSSSQDLHWKAKGSFFISSSWRSPLAFACGELAAALGCGNTVIFRPHPDSFLIGYLLVQVFWKAGFSKETLQFLYCSDECLFQISQELLKKIFFPSLPKVTGENSIILSSLCDRNCALKDLIFSAFYFSGQRSSCASLAIVEAELYDDPRFLQQLKDAAKSLKSGFPWDFSTQIVPLKHSFSKKEIEEELLFLEEGEKWLLPPKKEANHPSLWSPGVKLGTKIEHLPRKRPFSFPLLSIMRAKNFSEAIDLATQIPQGVVAGLHSLDLREHEEWQKKIPIENRYINRSIVLSLAGRQLGIGQNSFKSGGPNYLQKFLKPQQKNLPKEKIPVNEQVNNLTLLIGKIDLSAEELGLWYASIANYAYWWKKLQVPRDPTKIIGQDNLLNYCPKKKVVLRIEASASPLDVFRSCAAALTCFCPLEISCEPSVVSHLYQDLSSFFPFTPETQEEFFLRKTQESLKDIRVLQNAALCENSQEGCELPYAPVLANGRYELLHYLLEISLSYDYHRYGNLGIREGDLRKPVL